MKVPALLRATYYPLNKIEISASALLANYRYLSNLNINNSIAPVLKSNAYGHGLTLVAKVLDDVRAPFFCVDSLYEAYELYKIGIKTPILIMGYTNPKNLTVKKLPFSFAVYDKETIAVLQKYQPQAGIHLFVDTGMHREGITLSELPQILKYISSVKNIQIEGLMSHFGASDQYGNAVTKEQIKNFQIAQEIVANAGIQPKWVHIGNSAVSLLVKNYAGKSGNLIRTGIALYGFGGVVDAKLKPALRVLTTLGQIKQLKKGESVGYDFTYTAKKDMTLGILPYGYYDGMDRRLSNKGYVLINGVFCPIVGRVSMNITTVDISNVSKPKVGQMVTVYSNKTVDLNSIQNAAKLANTLEHDLLVHLAESTKRVVV